MRVHSRHIRRSSLRTSNPELLILVTGTSSLPPPSGGAALRFRRLKLQERPGAHPSREPGMSAVLVGHACAASFELKSLSTVAIPSCSRGVRGSREIERHANMAASQLRSAQCQQSTGGSCSVARSHDSGFQSQAGVVRTTRSH